MKTLRKDADEAFESLDMYERKLWTLKIRECNDLRPSIEAILVIVFFMYS